MMKQNGLKLSAVFILVNVTCSAVAFLVLFLITSAAFQLGLLRPAPYMQVITLVLAGFFSGSLLSALAVKKVLAPFRRFSDESERIARGDFSIRCDTHSPILEVRQIARNLNAMVEELGTVETLREDFIAGVSHELKTPLTAIEGYAVLLGEPDITAAEQRQYTQEILDSSRRLSRMVSSILHLSSLDHCSELPGCREFSLDEQLRQCLLELEPHWTRKHLELDLELPEVRCTGSEELCRQIWQNLYSNAIKFTPDGGTITTRITTEPGWVTVSISDTGIGMPGEVQKHIFEKFYQGDASHSTNGTGLGLALAKRITDLHGGSISVRSAPGDGSCFSVRLPVQPASRAALCQIRSIIKKGAVGLPCSGKTHGSCRSPFPVSRERIFFYL